MQILIHCMLWNLMVDFIMLWSKSAPLRPYSASRCQQGRKIFNIIPIRLLKSDYVGWLQIKNSSSHLWYLGWQRFTNMISPGEFIWLPSFIFSCLSFYLLFFWYWLNLCVLSITLSSRANGGEKIMANKAETSGTFPFGFFFRGHFQSAVVQFLCFFHLVPYHDMLINWGQRLVKLLMMLHVWK